MLGRCSTTELHSPGPVFPASRIGSFPLTQGQARMEDKSSALDQLGRIRILVLLAGCVTGQVTLPSRPTLSSVTLGKRAGPVAPRLTASVVALLEDRGLVLSTHSSSQPSHPVPEAPLPSSGLAYTQTHMQAKHTYVSNKK